MRRILPLVASLVVVAGCGPGAGDGGSDSSGGPRTRAEKGIPWGENLDQALATAKKENRPVLVDFYTDWCGYCKKLDQNTFVDKEVVELASKAIPVKVNGERQPGIAAQYRVNAFPMVLILNPEGEVRVRLTGYMPPAEFAAALSKHL